MDGSQVRSQAKALGSNGIQCQVCAHWISLVRWILRHFKLRMLSSCARWRRRRSQRAQCFGRPRCLRRSLRAKGRCLRCHGPHPMEETAEWGGGVLRAMGKRGVVTRKQVAESLPHTPSGHPSHEGPSPGAVGTPGPIRPSPAKDMLPGRSHGSMRCPTPLPRPPARRQGFPPRGWLASSVGRWIPDDALAQWPLVVYTVDVVCLVVMVLWASWKILQVSVFGLDSPEVPFL